MAISFKREGGEIPVKSQTPSAEPEKLKKLLFVTAKYRTDKGNYLDLIFDGVSNSDSSMESLSAEDVPLKTDIKTFHSEVHDKTGKFRASINFEFSTLLYKYTKEPNGGE